MFDIGQLRIQIEGLRRANPDLAEDEVLRMLESITDYKAALARLLRTVLDSEEYAEADTRLINDLKVRRARLEHRAEVYRELMLKILQSADLKKVELPERTLSQVSGTPQIVGEPDVNALPDDLVRIKREPDRPAIREALLARREVPGLSLSNSPPSLQIRK
jgi:hypothetical protein